MSDSRSRLSSLNCRLFAVWMIGLVCNFTHSGQNATAQQPQTSADTQQGFEGDWPDNPRPNTTKLPVNGSDLPSLRAQLGEISKNITTQTIQLEELKKREKELSTSIKLFDRDLSLAQKAETDLNKILSELIAKQERFQRVVDVASVQLQREQTTLRNKLVEIYKAKRSYASSDVLTESKSFAAFLRKSHYLEVLARRDENYLNRIGNLIERAKKDVGSLNTVRSEREKVLSTLATNQEQIRQKKAELSAMLQQQLQEKKTQELALEKLRTAADELEQTIENLLNKTSEIRKPEAAITQDFATQKGKLDFPVQGKLITGFGSGKHQDFSDTLYRKGVEVETKPGEAVNSIATGTVAFVETMPTLGQVLVIDHGDRFYSLYGRLNEVNVAPGEQINRGQAIAKTSAKDDRGRNFYFELREGGKAIDPADFFKPGILPKYKDTRKGAKKRS